jgi:hypothetical protein
MAKLLMKSLSADLPALAELIRSQGRGRDTVLAHITPQEAALLKKRGGSGSMNPSTGLPEFQEDYSYDIGFGEGVYNPPVESYDTQGADFTPQQVQDYGYTDTSPPVDYSQMDIGFGPGEFTPPTTAADIQGRTFTPEENAMFGYTPAAPAPAPAPPRGVMDRLGITEKDLPRLGLGALLTGG